MFTIVFNCLLGLALVFIGSYLIFFKRDYVVGGICMIYAQLLLIEMELKKINMRGGK